VAYLTGVGQLTMRLAAEILHASLLKRQNVLVHKKASASAWGISGF